MPGSTTSELSVRLNPSSVCSPPAFIAIPSCAGLNPPILSCVAGSEHIDHGTLPSATLRPRIVCSDRYERPAAAKHSRCTHIAACTLAVCRFLMTVASLPASSCKVSAEAATLLARHPDCLQQLGLRKFMSEHPTRSSYCHPLSICAPLLGLCVCPGQLLTKAVSAGFGV